MWARAGGWLLLPYAVLLWFTAVPAAVAVVAFAIAVVGLLGIVVAVVVAMFRYGRAAVGILGAVLFLAGIALFGLDPFPGAIDGLSQWWPSVFTQPQTVGTWYWTVLALGVVLTGVGLLVTLLIVAVVGADSREQRDRVR